MPTGRVKWFDNRKGFGFVVGSMGEDIFIHFTAIQTNGFRTLNDGELIHYDFFQGPKGLLAKDVRRVNEDAGPAESTATLRPSPNDDDRRRAREFFGDAPPERVVEAASGGA